MTGKKSFRGYLDRLRENLETLDSAIADAKAMSKKGSDGRARLKTLRDLIELRDKILLNIKSHLLGRHETGASNEPDDVWENNSQVMYERWFNSQMSPWIRKDLELKCADCGVSNDQVSNRHFPGKCEDSFPFNEIKPAENINLCNKCYEKREKPWTEDVEEIDTSPLMEVFRGFALSGMMAEEAHEKLARHVLSLPEPERSKAIEELEHKNMTGTVEKIKALEGDRDNAGSAW